MTGAELKEWRESRGLSQERLARALGVAQSTVHRWESGDRPIPDPLVALALSTLSRRYRVVQVV